MPIYEYECRCGFHFEESHTIDERLPRSCPECSGDCHIVISPSNFRIANPIELHNPDGSLCGKLPDSNKVERPSTPAYSDSFRSPERVRYFAKDGTVFGLNRKRGK